MCLGTLLNRDCINVNKSYFHKKVIVKLGVFLFCFTSNFRASPQSKTLGEEAERQLLPVYWVNLPEERN